MKFPAHFAAGAGLGAIAALNDSPEWVAAGICSVMTHPVLDNMNVGTYKMYHGLGKGSSLVWGSLFYGLAIFAAGWLTWYHPMIGVCGFVAWLSYDHAHAVRWIQKKLGRPLTYPDLHNDGVMFPKWLETRWALVPQSVFAGLFTWMVIGG